ncbi:MAG TPA: nucleoside hydrolase [Acidobacteriota bacterium]|nr:nucleoside hydrolase [Acidobacteriota bacterium]
MTVPVTPCPFRFTLQAVVGLGAILFCLWVQPLGAHDAQPTRIIVDTDMALDDVRALILLTAIDEIDLACVVTSDGACTPQSGAANAARLLAYLDRPEIPVGVGLTLGEPGPPWRPMSESLGWADVTAAGAQEPAADGLALVTDVLTRSDGRMVYVCLGPLSNLAALMRTHPQLVEDGLAEIYYQGSVPDTTAGSWNTARDSAAAVGVFRGDVPIRVFDLEDSAYTVFDAAFLEQFTPCSSATCGLLRRLHEHPRVRGLVDAGHFRCWDEAVALCLADQALCSFVPLPGRDHVVTASSWQQTAARAMYVNLLTEDTPVKQNEPATVVFARFPSDPGLLRDDVRACADAIIERHGLDEWRAVVLTNEFHRHLGAYSILGAKMGVRAREILNAPSDELRVISHAGNTPPLSCMNDGLQVGTGASLGRGMITVTDAVAAAEAVFIAEQRRLTLRVRPEIVADIEDSLGRLLQTTGSLTPEYWDGVRDLALTYWRDWDRGTIFVETLEQEAGRGR